MAKEDEAPAYKIQFKDNTHAVLAERLFEEEHEISMDLRIGNTLYFSKEWWDKCLIEKDEFQFVLEDICTVGEMDYTPEIEVIQFDFENEGNEPDPRDDKDYYSGPEPRSRQGNNLRYRDDGGTDGG